MLFISSPHISQAMAHAARLRSPPHQHTTRKPLHRRRQSSLRTSVRRASGGHRFCRKRRRFRRFSESAAVYCTGAGTVSCVCCHPPALPSPRRVGPAASGRPLPDTPPPTSPGKLRVNHRRAARFKFRRRVDRRRKDAATRRRRWPVEPAFKYKNQWCRWWPSRRRQPSSSRAAVRLMRAAGDDAQTRGTATRRAA